MPDTSPTHPHDLLQRPLHDLRISVTDRCNLRCTYCMPADKYGEHYQFLPRAALLSFEEITRVARAAIRLGAKKLRITGGEPLLRKDLPDLIAMLAALPGVEDLALTSNGLLLARDAQALKEAGLQRVTVSLDSLDDTTFGAMNGRAVGTAPVLEGIAAAQRAGFSSMKINVVVQQGVNVQEVLPLAERFRFTGIVLRFIEYMDVGTLNQWDRSQVFSSRALIAHISAKYPLRPATPQYRGEVAARYVYEDGGGEIGVISSVTQPFCGDCTRLRLSSDGKFYTCLFAQEGADVRALLRAGADDAAIENFIVNLWRERSDRYSEERAGLAVQRPKVEMYHVGG